MTNVFSTAINFGVLGLLRCLHRLQIQTKLEVEQNGIIFPRSLKHQSKHGTNSHVTYSLKDVSDDDICEAVKRAHVDARASVENLGCCRSIKSFSLWILMAMTLMVMN